MRSFRSFIGLLLFFSCSRTPEQAVSLYVVQTSNGFESAGGVAISERHVLTSANLFKHVDKAHILNAQGQWFAAHVQKRDPDLGMALLSLDDATMPSAPIGASGDLLKSDSLHTQSFDVNGQPILHQGRLVGFKYYATLAYMETNLDTQDQARGAGVFGPYGKMVGLQSFKTQPERTFVLPIEHVCNGPNALTTGLLGERRDGRAFRTTRAEAKRHSKPRLEKMKYEDIQCQQTFSNRAMIGSLTLLDAKDNPTYVKPMRFRVESSNSNREQKVIARGIIEPKDMRWKAQSEMYASLHTKMLDAFGELWVEDVLKPNDYGEIRYRIPFKRFCSHVHDGDIHAFTILLADGRFSGRMVFSGLAEFCTGKVKGPGNQWEAEWFSTQPQKEIKGTNNIAVEKKKKKSTRKKKAKKKKKKRRKKKRR